MAFGIFFYCLSCKVQRPLTVEDSKSTTQGRYVKKGFIQKKLKTLTGSIIQHIHPNKDFLNLNSLDGHGWTDIGSVTISW